LSFLPTPTACSTHRLAGLLHPATGHGVRRDSRDTVPIHCLALLRCIQSEPLPSPSSSALHPLEPQGWSPHVAAQLPSRRPTRIRPRSARALGSFCRSSTSGPRTSSESAQPHGVSAAPPRGCSSGHSPLDIERSRLARTDPKTRPIQAHRTDRHRPCLRRDLRSPCPSDRAPIATSHSLRESATSFTPAEARARSHRAPTSAWIPSLPEGSSVFPTW
jgi:hypothetical protein